MFQREILQLFLDTADTQPVRQRRIDLHRLQRFDPLLFRNAIIQRAHVVQPVGQLDDDNSNILCHGQQHLAYIFRLLLCPAGIRNIGELCHTIHQFGYIAAKLLFYILQRYGSIFHHIMQQPTDDGIRIHAQSYQYYRHFYGMGNIWVTGRTHLSFVRLFCQLIGRSYPRNIIGLIGFFYGIRQFLIHGVHRSPILSGAFGRFGSVPAPPSFLRFLSQSLQAAYPPSAPAPA